MASNAPRQDHVTMNSTRARQGRFGRHVLWVLLVSTALAGLAMFGAWTWQGDQPTSADITNGPIRTPAEARLFDHPNPSQMTRQRPADAASATGAPDNPPSGGPPARPR